MNDEKTVQWYERRGVTPPSSTPHGVKLDDLGDRLRPLKARSWKLEGNRLIAKTDLGDVVNYIDPGVIMTGVDERNLPVFKRL